MDYPYEASDEASESELLNQSLSMWRGWGSLDTDPSARPTLLDLHTAASIGLYDSVSAYTASSEADINQRNRGGWTPLMYASYIGHDNVVNLLLDAGAQVDLRNEKGASALMLTSSCGNESVAYFLVQQGAEIENRDSKGWTSLFYATYAGHQKVVQFLLDNGANANAREPRLGITPFMMAAAEGHEIILSLLLKHGVDVNLRNKNGETARSLALTNGHMKILGLIDSIGMSPSSLRSEAGLSTMVDLSSSDESYQRPNRPHGRSGRSKGRGPSIRDGPETLAKLLGERKGARQGGVMPGGDYGTPDDFVSYRNEGNQLSSQLSAQSQDATSIKQLDQDLSHSGEGRVWTSPFHGLVPSVDNDENDDPAFCKSGALTIRSSNSSNSSGGLAAALAVGRRSSCPNTSSSADDLSSDASGRSLPATPSSHSSEGVVRAGQLSDQLSFSLSQGLVDRGYLESSLTGVATLDDREMTRPSSNGGLPPLAGPLHSSQSSQAHFQLKQPVTGDYAANGIGYRSSVPPLSGEVVALAGGGDVRQHRPLPYQDLGNLLEDLGLRAKYFHVLEEQDVDLRVFLTLTDSDLKEVGIKLMGPRRKMTNAIARWHSQARPFADSLEQAYADRVETAMQEMAIQLQEAIVRKDELEGQVMQERELRSVVEACLVEDRKTYQQLLSLVSDARKLCHNTRQLYDSVRACQTELTRRLQMCPSSFIPKDARLEGLSQQFGSQLQLESLQQQQQQQQQQLRAGSEGGSLSSPQAEQNPLVSAITSSLVTSVAGVEGRLGAGSPPTATAATPGGSGGSYRGSPVNPEGEELTMLTLNDLLVRLGQSSHQLGRAVALATNNMDQLIDGQTVGFSPNSSGNSLP